MYAHFSCRFVHIFVVDCRFNESIVYVDLLHKTGVDCRQNGQKCCDVHLVRTPTNPPPSIYLIVNQMANF